MAEYGERYDEIPAVGADVAALTVDEPERAEAVRQRYALPFPVLCDTERKVVQAWDLYNREEKGGIARTAIFVLDRERRVQFCSADGTVSRVRAQDMLEFLRSGRPDREGPPPQRRTIFPTLGEMVRTALPALRLSLRPPKR